MKRSYALSAVWLFVCMVMSAGFVIQAISIDGLSNAPAFSAVQPVHGLSDMDMADRWGMADAVERRSYVDPAPGLSVFYHGNGPGEFIVARRDSIPALYSLADAAHFLPALRSKSLELIT